MIQSTTGTGLGASGKYTTKEITSLTNFTVAMAGRVELAE